MAEHFNVKQLYKDGNILPLKIKSRLENKSITMFDSYLILPSSLINLAINYKVETLKGIFPYIFVNKNNLNYQGEFPSYLTFLQSANDITENEYNNIRSEYSDSNLRPPQ